MLKRGKGGEVEERQLLFHIDDVLTLTALLPVVTMDTHTHVLKQIHTYTYKGVAATTCKTLRCTVVRCVGANAYNGHSYFGQLKQKAEERHIEVKRERERGRGVRQVNVQ